VIGYPLSGKLGTYRWTGASRSRRFWSKSNAAAAEVTWFRSASNPESCFWSRGNTLLQVSNTKSFGPYNLASDCYCRPDIPGGWPTLLLMAESEFPTKPWSYISRAAYLASSIWLAYSGAMMAVCFCDC